MSDVIIFMEKYLSLFADGRKEDIKRRLGLIWHLYQKNYINTEQIKNEIQNNLHKHWEIADDLPEMINSYCFVIYQFLDAGLIALDSFNLKLTNCADEDMKDMKQYFFQSVLEKVIKKYKEDNKATENVDKFIKLLEDMETDDPKTWLKNFPKISI